MLALILDLEVIVSVLDDLFPDGEVRIDSFNIKEASERNLTWLYICMIPDEGVIMNGHSHETNLSRGYLDVEQALILCGDKNDEKMWPTYEPPGLN